MNTVSLLRWTCLAAIVLGVSAGTSHSATATNGPEISDHLLARQIHNAIVEDASLPYCAHVVSVHVQDGVVTLKGRVHSNKEKTKLRVKAASLAGKEKVVDNIRLFEDKEID